MASRMDERELEETLTDLGGRLAYPARDLWPAVRERIAARRRPWWHAMVAPRSPLIPVTATLLVILIAVLAISPEARAKAAEILRVGGIEIFRETATPSPTGTARPSVPTPPVSFQGTRVTLSEARAQAGFALRVATAAELGDPDEIYLETLSAGNRVTFVYRSRPGIPVSSQAGVSAVVVEFQGSVDQNVMGKVTGPATKVESVSVAGPPSGAGVWLEGEPHQVIYRDSRGNFIQDTLRLAGNTLIWEQGSLTLRLEAQVTKDVAIRIAESFR